MFDTAEQQVRLTKMAWGSAIATLVIGQLHALARFRTADGAADLDLPLTAAWAKPADRVLDPLLSWGGPDTVYLTFGKWWVIALLIMAVTGYMVMRLREPYGVEKWGWRLFLLGTVLLAIGAGTYYWGQWTTYNVLEDVGLWTDVPGALLTAIGGTTLGIALLRRRAKPVLAGVLLLLTIPSIIGISMVTSLGNTSLPAMFAVAMLASSTTESVTRRAPAAPHSEVLHG